MCGSKKGHFLRKRGKFDYIYSLTPTPFLGINYYRGEQNITINDLSLPQNGLKCILTIYMGEGGGCGRTNFPTRKIRNYKKTISTKR